METIPIRKLVFWPAVVTLAITLLRLTWGTHYDVAPPGFAEMGVFAKWFRLGAIPQLTTWIAFTVLTGAVTGSIAGAIKSRRPAEPARGVVTV